MIELTELPKQMKHLKRSAKGYPVPYFATWIDGVPDFRLIEPETVLRCISFSLCWVCGKKLGRFKAHVVGPMCAITRAIGDPPSHLDCAIFSARNCPFMANPGAQRNTRDLPEGATMHPGGLARNPGTVGVWTQTRCLPTRAGGGVLFELDDPEHVTWWNAGREATRAEVEHSVETGLPLLVEEADREGPRARAELFKRKAAFDALLDQSFGGGAKK